jgi:hypothetical protein
LLLQVDSDWRLGISKSLHIHVVKHVKYIFFLERAGELRINILRRKRGKDPQSVTDMKGLQPTLNYMLRYSYKRVVSR